jgi:integrase
VKGSTFKRCGCRDPRTGKPLGQSCPQLRRPGGAWSARHGVWHYQIELPARADGARRPLRPGGYPTRADASADLDRVRAALGAPDPADPGQQALCGDLIEAAVKAGQPVPSPDQVRRFLRLQRLPDQMPTVAEWLTAWLDGRKTIKTGTRRSYACHIRAYLIPHLGHIRLDRLRAEDIDAMLEGIEERNAAIRALRDSPDPRERARAAGLRPAGPATVRRVHAALRKALNDAIRKARLIDANPALLVELPPEKTPKALVWTADRVTRWQATGAVPSPVMVWTPAHTGAFLDHAHESGDPLYALYHLIAYRGLRRGEACGLHWDDLDLHAKTLTVRWQIVQHGWATALDTPKTNGSEATIALDTATVDALKAHHARQHRARLAAGPAWTPTALVFTTPTGAPLHPAEVTDNFHRLRAEAGLPPIRLHDLRHGAATLALAAGADMKTVQAMLRHTSYTLTANTYTHVLPDLAHQAAEAAAAIVPRRTPATAATRQTGAGPRHPSPRS